jgi:hypothetical protein
MTLEQVIRWLEDNSTLLQAIVAVGVIALGIWAIVTGVPRSIIRGWRAVERRYTDYRAYRMAMSAAPRPGDFKPIEPSAKPIDVTHELDRLLEEADAIRQGLEADRSDQPRQARWTNRAQHFVTENFPNYATDFRIAREPHQHLGGAHVPEIWRPLKRIAAQMEVLREIKRSLRTPPAT